MSQSPCLVFPPGLEHTGQVEFLPQPAPPSDITALEQVAFSFPNGYSISLPPLLAAYSHSASEGNLPPAHSENALAWFQSTQATGWTSPTGLKSAPDALHAPASTALRQRVLAEFTWQRAGEATLAAYRKALNQS